VAEFGLQEALEAAAKAASEAKVVRPAEQALAARAAKAAPPAAAPTVPSAVTPPIEPTPGSVVAPQLNPSEPPSNLPPPAPDPTAAVPTPPAVAPQAADAAPAPVAPESATESPVAPPAPPLAPGEVAPGNQIAPIPAPPPPGLTDVQTSARRFLTAEMGDFNGKLDLTHLPNVDTINAPDKLKAALLQVADDNKDAIEASRGPAANNNEMASLAEDLSINQDVLKQKFDAEFGPENADNGVQRRAIVRAARLTVVNELGTVAAIGDKLLNGAATSADVVAYQQHMEALSSWMTNLASPTAEAGRDLQALSVPVGLPPAVMDHIAQIIKQNNPNMQVTAQAIKNAISPSGVADIVHGTNFYGRLAIAGRSLLTRTLINGILSGPTFLRVIVGNSTNLLKHVVDPISALAVRKAANAVNSLYSLGANNGMFGMASHWGTYPSPDENITMNDVMAHMHGLIAAQADAFRLAGRVMLTGQSLDGVMRFDPTEMASARNIDPKLGSTLSILPEWQGTWYGALAKGIDRFVDFPGQRMIGSIDEYDKTLGYRMWLQMMQTKEVGNRLREGTLRPGDAGAIMKDLMEHPSPEMQQAAEAYGHRISFQTPFAPGSPGAAVSDFVHNKIPQIQWIMPFFRTLTNIFKQGVGESTLLGEFRARYRKQLADPGFEGELARGRLATGIAFTTMVAWMVIHDRYAGDPPKDARERQIWELDGRTPNSIRIPSLTGGRDSWYSCAWLEPWATTAGITADIIRLKAYLSGYGEDRTLMTHSQMLDDAAEHVVASAVQMVGDKSMMQGPAAFAEMYNDPQRGFNTWKNKLLASMVPYSGFTKMIRNFQDPYLRQAKTLVETVENNLPTIFGGFGSKSLPARPDVFGEPRKTATGNSLLGPLTPMPASVDKSDPVTDEIQRLSDAQRVIAINMPDHRISLTADGKGLQGGSGMMLKPDQYTDLVRLARHDPVFNNGTMTFKQRLEQLMNGGLYTDPRTTDAMRIELLGNVQHEADKRGRIMLYNNNISFQQDYTAWDANVKRLKYPGK
jgi:hypothetical protein